VQWLAISKEMMVRPQQYFPLVPAPADPVGSKMCFGTTCINEADKWLDIMNMANWRVESAQASYDWHCNTRTGTTQITFAQAFEEVPEVKLFVNKIDECGFTSFEWTTSIEEVTTVGFKVKTYGYQMYSLSWSWIAWSKDMAQNGGATAGASKGGGGSVAVAGTGSKYEAGAWPGGWCHPPDAVCKSLGIKDNMCGTCAKTPTGFKLENTKAGLRWGAAGAHVDGKSFDDNYMDKGSTQARNICILAKYGNKPAALPEFPTSGCAGHTQSGIPAQAHWYGNCRTGSKETSCCSNAALMVPGQDFGKFAVGNSCGSDGDTDSVLGSLSCEFGSASMMAPWPNKACYPIDKACTDLGVKDNLCGKCQKTAIGYKLVNYEAGLRFAGASFDDNEVGKGTVQARNICILSRYGNKGQVTRQPLSSCAGTVQASSVDSQVHWYGNCKEGTVKEKDCCTNAFVVGSFFDWTKYAKGNACQGDSDTDRTLGDIECAFDDGTYKQGAWPMGYCNPLRFVLPLHCASLSAPV